MCMLAVGLMCISFFYYMSVSELIIITSEPSVVGGDNCEYSSVKIPQNTTVHKVCELLNCE